MLYHGNQKKMFLVLSLMSMKKVLEQLLLTMSVQLELARNFTPSM